MLRKRAILLKAIERKINAERDDRLEQMRRALKASAMTKDLSFIEAMCRDQFQPLGQMVIYAAMNTSTLEKEYAIYLKDKDWERVGKLIKDAYCKIIETICSEYGIEQSAVPELKKRLDFESVVDNQIDIVRTKNITPIKGQRLNLGIQIAILVITLITGVVTLLQFFGVHLVTVSNTVYK